MKTYNIECVNCGKTFVAHKSNTKTCSTNCRVALSYRKKYGNTVVLNDKGVQQKKTFMHKEDVERLTALQQNNAYNVQHQTTIGTKSKTLNTISIADILRKQENDQYYLCTDLPDKINHNGISLSKLGYIDFYEAGKLRRLKNNPERTIWVCSGLTYNHKYREKIVIYLTTEISNVSTFNKKHIRELDTFMPLNTVVQED